jgi:hypothetical protein
MPALQSWLVRIVVGLFSMGVVVVATLLIRSATERSGSASVEELPRPDTPPVEFAYLDGSRVLAYLGQAEGGLSKSEKRSLGSSQSVTASLSAGTAAQVGAASQSQQSSEATVSPTVADRFYRLLRVLRVNGGAETCTRRLGHSAPWMGTIDAGVSPQNTEEHIKQQLSCIGEGNVVRIFNAHLYLAPYASVLTRVRYALPYLGDFGRRRHPAEAPVPPDLQRALGDYRRRVGRDPRLPFVLPAITNYLDNPQETVTFFVPTRYRGLTAEPSLLSGKVTVVGKILYADLRRGTTSTGAATRQSTPRERFPREYVDFQTIETFGSALKKARSTLLEELGVCPVALPARPARPQPAQRSSPSQTCRRQRESVIDQVGRSVTFPAPVVVVLPLGIYR